VLKNKNDSVTTASRKPLFYEKVVEQLQNFKNKIAKIPVKQPLQYAGVVLHNEAL
jgi:hypothetical protein